MAPTIRYGDPTPPTRLPNPTGWPSTPGVATTPPAAQALAAVKVGATRYTATFTSQQVKNRRVMAQALRDAIKPEEIALYLRTVIVNGRNPGDCSIDDEGKLVTPAIIDANATYVPADERVRLAALHLYYQYGHGTPGNAAEVEEMIRKASESMVERPDYSSLDDEELATLRRLQRKALEGKGKR